MFGKLSIIILTLFCIFLYFLGITYVHLTDADEAFYSLTAKEMIAQKSFLIPVIFGKPQFEKPPLFYWLLIFSFKIFGVGEFAARLVPILFGLLGVLGTYIFMKKLFDHSISFQAALILATNLLYFVLSKGVLTDIVFSVFLTFSLYSFYIWHRSKKDIWLVLYMIFISLAVLTKGPLAIGLSFLTIILFLVLTGGLEFFPRFLFNRYWAIFLVLGCSWYAYAFLKHGRDLWTEFFVHDNWHRILRAEHKNLDKWYFYPAVIIGGMFPWTAYLLTLGKGFQKYRNEYLFFICWAVSVFSVFTIAHSKLMAYLLPLFPPLCCMLSISLNSLPKRSKKVVVAGSLNILLGIGLFLSLFLIKSLYPFLYAPLAKPIFLVSISTVIAGIFLALNKVKQAAFTNVAGFMIFTLVLVSTPPGILDAAFSDYAVRKVVSENNYSNKPIVCNKMYARGIYFYTENPVLVTATSQNPFWSKHPIEILSKDEEILNFFQDQDMVICVIKSGDLERLDQIFAGKRQNKVISKSWNKLIVLSEKTDRG